MTKSGAIIKQLNYVNSDPLNDCSSTAVISNISHIYTKAESRFLPTTNYICQATIPRGMAKPVAVKAIILRAKVKRLEKLNGTDYEGTI